MKTNLIPGRIRQPRKQQLHTFSNASKFRKSAGEDIGIWSLDAVLSRLPVSRKVDKTGLSVTAPMKAGMLPRLEDEEGRHFTPSEVLM